MEIEDLKNTWLALDEKLGQNKGLNDRIIKDMLQTRSNKSMGCLVGYDIFGLCILIMVLPVIAYVWFNFDHITRLASGSVFLIFMFVVILFFVFWTGTKIALLMKIDLSQEVMQNIRRANRYNILIKREKLISVFVLPVIAVFFFYLYLQVDAPIMAWITMTCLFVVAVIFSIWSYKRIYDKNIKSILNSLQELKELED